MEDSSNAKRIKLGISTKLIGLLIPIIVIVIAIILFLIYTNTSKIILSKSEELLTSNSKSVDNNVSAWMNKVITALNTERDTMEYFSLDTEEELNYIKHTANKYEAFPAGIYVATLDGNLEHASFVPGSDFNVFEKSWYKDGIKSEDFILGSVYFDEDSQNYVVGASGVLKDSQGTVRGVAAADIYLNAISDIVSKVQLEKTGGVFLVDAKTNTIIGHKDTALVGTTLDKQNDAMYSYILEQIHNKTDGLQIYEPKGGSPIYVNISEIPGSNWISISYVPKQEVMSDLDALVRVIIGIAVISVIILSILIIILIRKMIIKPIKRIDHVASQIAEGKLNQTIDYQSGDEFGTLVFNFNKTVNRLRDYVNYIDEISKVLEEIADGNLLFSLRYDYAGEFSKVKIALEHISTSLNNTLSQINQSAEEVSSGSEQVSNGAQALSQGATEQASSVEELAATVTEITEQVRSNAEFAKQASQKVKDVSGKLQISDEKMQSMIAAMSEISHKSGEIGKIIKTIEDIAFQTNILALNAAVEAARAGAAGKGFAVVADEVRNLASKSADASKNTSVLIEGTITAVDNGTRIAGETAQSLLAAVENADEVSSVVNNISVATNDQAEALDQVTQGIDQISSVVQTNSATSEESAAASEQLFAQAKKMKDLVERFHLKSR